MDGVELMVVFGYGSTNNTSSKKHKTMLRRPLLVMGPLGVVTTMELLFLIMGIALVCWHFGHYYYVSVKHPFMGHGREHQKKYVPFIYTACLGSNRLILRLIAQLTRL